ncbi:MAG: vWA domain-containing protein [Myxococcota bacterium]
MSRQNLPNASIARRRRFPLTLCAVVGSAIAIPLYLTAGADSDDAAAVETNAAEAVAAKAPPVAVAVPDKAERPGALEGLSLRSVAEEEVAAADEVAAPSPAAKSVSAPRPGRHHGEAGVLGVDGKSGGKGGYEEQLQANRLTAGRTSDLSDSSSLDALRDKAIAADQALAQAIPDHRRVGPQPGTNDNPTTLDIGLVLDTTGSMGDELAYLKVELRSIAQAVEAEFPGVTQRYALVAYRDHSDQFLVRNYDFAPIDEFVAHLGEQSAGGGGDHPEAMDAAMAATTQLRWSTQTDAAQMVFLVADAPPHAADYTTFVEANGSLADAGISVYPVASSGVETVCEYLMRWAARTTGGEYIFLTDHSGIGAPHAKAHVDQFELKTLRDHMLEVIRNELTPVDQGRPEMWCGTANSAHDEATEGPTWFDRHGTFASVLGGVFLLGFALDMASSHVRKRRA